MNKAYGGEEKRPVAVLGETRPACPDKGCVGEVLGKVTTNRCGQDLSLIQAELNPTDVRSFIADCQSEEKNHYIDSLNGEPITWRSRFLVHSL
jgi:hypothetical protein